MTSTYKIGKAWRAAFGRAALVAWASVRSDLIDPSPNYRLVRESILEARALSKATGARLLLGYVPTKEHVYLPFVTDAETLARIVSDVPMLEPTDDGFLEFGSQPATVELTRRHLGDQARLLAEFAAAEGIAVLDLTPSFEEEAAGGGELYYPFDTHWNQQVHDLAARLMGLYLQPSLAGSASPAPCR